MMMLVHELASRCVSKCDNGWVSWRICTDEWMSEWKNEWSNDWVIEWIKVGWEMINNELPNSNW